MTSILVGVHAMFAREYEIIPNPPAPITWDEYAKESYIEYQLLLETENHNERAFQSFFEENPSFIPGAFELFGPSGHYPFQSQKFMERLLDDFPTLFGWPKIAYISPLFLLKSNVQIKRHLQMQAYRQQIFHKLLDKLLNGKPS